MLFLLLAKKYLWYWMALTTADLGFLNELFAFTAPGSDLHFFAEHKKTVSDLGTQFHGWASICPQDTGYWAGAAKRGLPLCRIRFSFQKATFFVRCTTIVISIKILAFLAVRRMHRFFPVI